MWAQFDLSHPRIVQALPKRLWVRDVEDLKSKVVGLLKVEPAA
jgi:hypothetical protein